MVVFHEKEGRRHAHCVWSRIDIDEMKAINIAFPKRKLNEIAKSLYLEHGWKMPEGFKNKALKNPLNYSRSEWQQAVRIGRRPADIKRELQDCWAISDSKKSFENALRESGYYLACGDRRGYVAIDVHGEVFSLSRQLGRKKKELAARLGKPEELQSVSDAKATIAKQLSTLFKRYTEELKTEHQKRMQPLLHTKQAMTTQHRSVRTKLDTYQKKRWQGEELKRSARIRRGFKGIWDKLNGRYFKTKKRNEQETWKCHTRDQKQQEELIQEQLAEHQALQAQINILREKNNIERKNLIRDLSHITKNEDMKTRSQEKVHVKTKRPRQNRSKGYEIDSPDNDFEPEI